MNRKTFLLLFALLGAGTFCSAQREYMKAPGYEFAAAAVQADRTVADGTHILGYTDAEVNINMRIGFEGYGESFQAIKLPASMLKEYAGQKISALRVAVGEEVKNVKMFVREELKGANVAEQTVESCGTTWNYVKLDNPYTITGDKDLYVGYSYMHEGNAYVIASDLTGYADGACYLGFKSDKEDYFDDYSASKYGLGKLLISAVVGEDVEAYGNSFSMLSASLEQYVQKDVPQDLNFELYNTGWNEITSAVMECDINGSKKEISLDMGDGLAPRSAFKYVMEDFVLTDDAKVTFSLKTVNGQPNMATLPDFSRDCKVYDGEGFKRTLLLEQFTGQSCGNCPEGSRAIEALIFNNEDRVIWVAHHTFNYDSFCTEPSLRYQAFFHGSMEAPIMMLNRTTHHLELETTDGVKEMDVLTTVPSYFAYANNYKNFLDDEIAQPARVSVDIDQSYDESTGTLIITVSGKKTGELEGKHVGLTVFILEDGQVAYQNGGSEDYVHNNIMREVITDYTGDALECDENGQYIMEYAYKIPSKFISYESRETTVPVRRNMKIVAFVSNYGDVKTDCMVFNATQEKFIPETYAGVSDTAENGGASFYAENGKVFSSVETASLEVYSLAGVKVRNEGLAHGVYVVRAVLENGENVTAKVVVK